MKVYFTYLGIRYKLQLLDFAFEEGVVFYFLSQKDNTIAGNSVSGIPSKMSCGVSLKLLSKIYFLAFEGTIVARGGGTGRAWGHVPATF